MILLLLTLVVGKETGQHIQVNYLAFLLITRLDGMYQKSKIDSMTPTDVSVSKGYMKFGVSKTLDRPADNPLKSSDIGEITRGIEQVTEKDKEMSIVEPMDVKKYTVGAEKSGTFIVKFKVGVAQTGLQLTYVVHNGDLYLLSFQDSTSTFDSPETQSILNKLIQSFRFLS